MKDYLSSLSFDRDRPGGPQFGFRFAKAPHARCGIAAGDVQSASAPRPQPLQELGACATSKTSGLPNSSIAAGRIVVGILGTVGIPLARMDTEPVRAALRSNEQ